MLHPGRLISSLSPSSPLQEQDIQIFPWLRKLLLSNSYEWFHPTPDQDTRIRMFPEVCEGLGDIVTEPVYMETGNNST